MARKSKQEILNEIHEEAVAEFNKIQTVVRPERIQCLEDRRFYSIAGAQWEGNLGLQFENKPKFEVNKINLAIIRIFNEYRNNRISVSFIPKDGSKSDGLADTCSGLYRADEQDSSAEEAYDNAFEEGVGGGIGAWRLRAEYEDDEDEDDERQRIRIEPIFDADSCVFFDLDAKRQDKSDATCCFVLTSMSRQAYINEFKDDPESWPKLIHRYEFDWAPQDIVYVAEYYRVEKHYETFHVFRGLDGQEEKFSETDLDDETLNILKATGFNEVRTKKVKKTRIRKYLLSGGGVLEDCGFIAGRHIPIVVFYGKRWFVDNVERCSGHVRLAKDAQRLKNMQLSKLGEISALSSVEKPIFAPEQMAGHAVMWSEDNIKNFPYLLLNPLTDGMGTPIATGPIGYTKPPQIPQALGALLQITEQDIQDVLGNQQAGEELQSGISGIAMELVQNRLDMQTFIYMSNMKKAIKRSGEIWLSMAKELLVEQGRKMKKIDSSGNHESVELMKPLVNEENGETYLSNDLSKADFDVSVEVGPTSSSKRASIARAATNMLQITQDAETQQVLTALALMNMEGEGLGEVREFFRKRLVSIGAAKPTEDDLKEMQSKAQNAAPDMQAQFLAASAQQAAAMAQKAQAGAMLDIAKVEQVKADTAKTLADVDAAAALHAVDMMERLTPPVGIPE